MYLDVRKIYLIDAYNVGEEGERLNLGRNEVDEHLLVKRRVGPVSGFTKSKTKQS